MSKEGHLGIVRNTSIPIVKTSLSALDTTSLISEKSAITPFEGISPGKL